MLRRPQVRLRGSQRGAAALIGLLVALALTGALVSGYALIAQRQYRIAFAEIEGQAASQFAVGLRGFVAAAQSNPALLPSNPFVNGGVEWLRPPTCGGLAGNPDAGYVPCNFTGQTLGQNYRTSITRIAATNAIEARLIFRVPVLDGDPATLILTAERVVEASLRQQSLPANGMFYEAFANVSTGANGPSAPVPAATDVGRVVVIVNNAPSNDIFLRVDGTNQMLANLNFGGFSVRNARDARFSGDLRVENRVQIDNGLTVTNGLTDIRGDAIFERNVVLQNIGRFASSGIYNAQLLTGAASYNVGKPNCAQAGNAPAIYTSFQATGSPNHGGVYRADALYDSRIDVQDLGGSWSVTPVVRGTRFTLQQTGVAISLNRTLDQTSPSDARIVVMTRCR